MSGGRSSAPGLPSRVGPRHPGIGPGSFRAGLSLWRRLFERRGFRAPAGVHAQERATAFRDKLSRGEPIYLLGLLSGHHDAGASLVAIDERGAPSLVACHQEEVLVGRRPHRGFPTQSVALILEALAERGLGPGDLHATLAAFDYPRVLALAVRQMLEELPASLELLWPGSHPEFPGFFTRPIGAPRQLGRSLGMPAPAQIIGMPHHGSHAAMSFAHSPFALEAEAVGILVLDGSGDEGSISTHLASGGRLKRIHANDSVWDSAGHFYGMLSSCLGGWSVGSSEGRWMAAAAYGNNDRASNPYYRTLRAMVVLGPDGSVQMNRALANWHAGGLRRPFSRALIAKIGRPIPVGRVGREDAQLRFDPERMEDWERDRVELAAATQLVFEDLLFHVAEHFVAQHDLRRLVLTGGTALNCVANGRLLQRLADRGLELWIPPLPADDGIHPGAAYQFALQNGASPGLPIEHVFLCGRAPSSGDVERALARDIGSLRVGYVGDAAGLARVCDAIIFLLSRGSVLGLFRGRAEAGRRALGHRSILADPTDPTIADRINREVKLREPFRPFGPMCTEAAAERLFELAPGARRNESAAYRWMTLAAKVRPEAARRVPAVVHCDGSVRPQIISSRDAFAVALLKAAGRRLGEEVLLNTSLNLRGPIVASPEQGVEVIRRSPGLDGIVFIDTEGGATLAWHDVDDGAKDGGRALRSTMRDWMKEQRASGA